MNETTSAVLALAAGAGAGAAAGALVVSLLSGPRGTPVPAPTPSPVKKLNITLKKDGGTCKASFDSPTDKHFVVDDYEPGVTFVIYNTDCDQEQVFRLREKRGTMGRRPIPAGCRFFARVPDDMPIGDTVDPYPECDFPLEKRYKGTYEYIVQLCSKDEGGCQTYDPEIEVKRR